MQYERDINKPYIITVTGTKGKTTVTRLLAKVYLQEKRPVLRVETDGYFVNGRQKGTLGGSKKLYGLVPTVAPGRYLRNLRNKKNAIAVLEASIGCASVYGGLCYRFHDIGIFTNVFEDHVGVGIKNRNHLAELKAKYIFGRIRPGGTTIFNADNSYVTKQLTRIPKKLDIKLIPAGLEFNYFDVEGHLKQGGRALTVKDHKIVVRSKSKDEEILDVRDVAWSFNGNFPPSLYNLMYVVGALYVEHGGKVSESNLKTIKNYRMKGGGRLLLFKNKRKKLTALVDYAHEKFSLREVGQLAKKMADNKTIGIVRLAPDRIDRVYRETGKAIANSFDILIVYDKIDGLNMKEYKNPRMGFFRKKGEISKILYDAIKKNQKDGREVYRVIEEEKAVAKAFSLAEEGDVVVHIANDDHRQSANIVKKQMGGILARRHT